MLLARILFYHYYDLNIYKMVHKINYIFIISFTVRGD